MKNKTLWAVVGVVVVAVIAAVVVMGMNKSGTPAPSGSTASTGNTNSASNGPMSMKDLFAAGTSQTCTFTNDDAQASTTGVIYVTSGHMRGDFTSVGSGRTIQSHMITDGQTSYVWTDQAAQGFKMSFASTTPSSGPNGAQNSVNPDEKVNYNCSPWSVDQSEFTLPANITFSDMSAMMGASAGAGASAGTPTGNSAECAMCAQAPNAAAQAQCRAALSCQ